jgi:1-acyl-sn-glycerol-3-phosphate acyltransferase
MECLSSCCNSWWKWNPEPVNIEGLGKPTRQENFRTTGVRDDDWLYLKTHDNNIQPLEKNMPAPLTPDNAYATDKSRATRWLRSMPGLTPRFYASMFSIVNRSRRQALAGVYDEEAWAVSSQDIFRTIESYGGHFDITGIEHLRNLKAPAVFIGNHMSTLETFVLPGLLVPYTRLCFVLKSDLTEMPVFGPVARATNPITVSRNNSRSDLGIVMDVGCERIKAGFSVCIFPQSTRQPFFSPRKFNSLGDKLAARANAQIIPFAVKTDFWGQGWPVKDFGRINPKLPIKIAFGPAIPAGTDSKTTHAGCLDFIIPHLQEWGVKCVDE